MKPVHHVSDTGKSGAGEPTALWNREEYLAGSRSYPALPFFTQKSPSITRFGRSINVPI